MSSPAAFVSDELVNATPRAFNARQWMFIASAWLLYTLVEVLLTLLTPGDKLPWFSSSVALLAIGVFWTLITPLVFSIAVRLRMDQVGLPRAIFVHSLMAVVTALCVPAVRLLVFHLMMPEWKSDFLRAFVVLFDRSVITYAMLALFGTALDRRRAYTASRNRSLTLLAQLSEARLQFLQRQLQPHFLFNALNTVAELARESPVVARRTLLNLGRLLDSAMAHADDPEVTLREELMTLEPFIQIQRLRFSDSLDIGIDVAPDTLAAHVPPLLLQPLIENAIRHGRAGRGERGKVTIVARRNGGRLTLRVEDDGARFSASHSASPIESRAGHGIGLRNTTERLTQLYGGDHRFRLHLENDGTTIAELDLPFRDSTLHSAAPHRRGEESIDAGDALEPHAATTNDRRSHEHLVYSGDELVAIVGLTARNDIPFDHGDPLTDTDTTNPPRLTARAWAAILGGWVIVGGIWMSQAYLQTLLSMGRSSFSTTYLDFMSTLAWVCLTPLVLWLARSKRVQRGNVRSALAFHFIGAILIAALQLKVVLSIGVMDRPLFITYNVRPFAVNVCIYFGILAWSHARDFEIWYRARGVCAARTLAAIARARMDATAIALHTPFLLYTLDSAATLALTSAARTERVVERLADLLRAVLQTAGQGAHTVRDELLLLERCLDVQHELSGVPTTVTATIDENTLGASVPPGVGNAVMDHVLARSRETPAMPLHVEVRPAGPGRWREIVFRVAPRMPVTPPSLSASQAG